MGMGVGNTLSSSNKQESTTSHLALFFLSPRSYPLTLSVRMITDLLKLFQSHETFPDGQARRQSNALYGSPLGGDPGSVQVQQICILCLELFSESLLNDSILTEAHW